MQEPSSACAENHMLVVVVGALHDVFVGDHLHDVQQLPTGPSPMQ